LLSTNTVTEAAKSAGLSVATLYRLLRCDEFKTEYRSMRRDIMETSIGRLQHATELAALTLRRNLSCGHPGSEIAAAKIVLENAVKGIEQTDFLERLETLEALEK